MTMASQFIRCLSICRYDSYIM